MILLFDKNTIMYEIPSFLYIGVIIVELNVASVLFFKIFRLLLIKLTSGR